MAIIRGKEFDDTLSGSGSNDSIYGFEGNDKLYGRSGNDVIDGGSEDDQLYGENGNDTLTGGEGNDILDGGSQGDVMRGGLGDDIYYVSSSWDKLIENAEEGNDTVMAYSSFSLGNNIENLNLLGSYSISGTGNALDNVITGNAGNNSLNGKEGNDQLIGGNGNDILNGGTGVDTLEGGIGNDKYYVDDENDVINENPSEGTDTVYADCNFILADNIENLYMTGQENLNATGNSLANLISGNSADNLIDGLGGNDSLYGNAGNDELLGSFGNDRLDGGSGNDILSANAGDDILNGASGIDTMSGDTGNDQYYIDNIEDTIIENKNEGNDTVFSYISYTLSDNVENLTMAGANRINGTGNELDNVITGNSNNNLLAGEDGDDSLNGGNGNDTLIGGDGNDILDGGSQGDVMQGGFGDDTYYVSSSWDKIVENDDEGNDTVLSYSTYTLEDNVENMTLTGSYRADGAGNELDNLITGNSNNNVLSGNDGNDTIEGGRGNDTLIGGSGDDTYYISDYSDKIIENTDEGVDTVISSVSHSLADNVENLIVTGTSSVDGDGNELDNTIKGGAGNNTLSGEGGNDTLIGGSSTDNLNGGTGDDILTGGAGKDVLVGGTGDDQLNGGAGNDIYDGYSEVGFGADTIDDASGANDLLNLENFSVSDVKFFGDFYNSLTIYFKDSDDLITINNYFNDNFTFYWPGEGYIETIRFNDFDASFSYISDHLL